MDSTSQCVSALLIGSKYSAVHKSIMLPSLLISELNLVHQWPSASSFRLPQSSSPRCAPRFSQQLSCLLFQAPQRWRCGSPPASRRCPSWTGNGRLPPAICTPSSSSDLPPPPLPPLPRSHVGLGYPHWASPRPREQRPGGGLGGAWRGRCDGAVWGRVGPPAPVVRVAAVRPVITCLLGAPLHRPLLFCDVSDCLEKTNVTKSEDMSGSLA